jgi:hypothetical protein
MILNFSIADGEMRVSWALGNLHTEAVATLPGSTVQFSNNCRQLWLWCLTARVSQFLGMGLSQFLFGSRRVWVRPLNQCRLPSDLKTCPVFIPEACFLFAHAHTGPSRGMDHSCYRLHCSLAVFRSSTTNS